MAQQGGVVSHVRIGEQVYSPLIPEKTADLIIGFEPPKRWGLTLFKGRAGYSQQNSAKAGQRCAQ